MELPGGGGVWLAPSPSPSGPAVPDRHDEHGVDTFIWPKPDTSTWPPVGTFSWPRTPETSELAIGPAARSSDSLTCPTRQPSMPTRVMSTETVRGHTATLGRPGVDESVDHRRASGAAQGRHSTLEENDFFLEFRHNKQKSHLYISWQRARTRAPKHPYRLTRDACPPHTRYACWRYNSDQPRGEVRTSLRALRMDSAQNFVESRSSKSHPVKLTSAIGVGCHHGARLIQPERIEHCRTQYDGAGSDVTAGPDGSVHCTLGCTFTY